MAYELTEISNMVVVIAGAVGSLLLIVFQSRCKRICWGCITRDLEPLKPKKAPISEAPAVPEPEPEP
tara:strand:- start:2314 stop:2514 length:201 start_codon:yes stop_codon:yes gene_type:complete